MSSLLRSVKKRKKSRVLGEVDVLSREEYSGQELDSKVEMIRALIPLGLMHVEELLDEEVKALAGERYARKEAALRGRRHGSNPGTVGLGGQRVPVRVPRVRSVAGGEIPLRSYEELSPDGAVNELLLRRVLYGISCRNYRVGRGSDSRSHRIVEFDGVSRIRPGEWGETSGDAGAGSVGRRRGGDLPGRENVCRRHDGCGPGHHNYGRQTLLRLRGDEYGERASTDSVSPFIDGTRPGHSLKACW